MSFYVFLISKKLIRKIYILLKRIIKKLFFNKYEFKILIIKYFINFKT